MSAKYKIIDHWYQGSKDFMQEVIVFKQNDKLGSICKTTDSYGVNVFKYHICFSPYEHLIKKYYTNTLQMSEQRVVKETTEEQWNEIYNIYKEACK